jgi:hypothetical protein
MDFVSPGFVLSGRPIKVGRPTNINDSGLTPLNALLAPAASVAPASAIVSAAGLLGLNAGLLQKPPTIQNPLASNPQNLIAQGIALAQQHQAQQQQQLLQQQQNQALLLAALNAQAGVSPNALALLQAQAQQQAALLTSMRAQAQAQVQAQVNALANSLSGSGSAAGAITPAPVVAPKNLNTRVYVGSIMYDLTAEHVKAVFEAFGTVSVFQLLISSSVDALTCHNSA